MATPRKKLDVLEETAKERELTPVSWWIGEHHHDRVRDALEGEGSQVEVQGGRLTRVRGLEVKVLSESPMRFALWCKEGVLDL